MGGLINPDTDKFPVRLCGGHRKDGELIWVTHAWLSTGCLPIVDDPDPEEAQEMEIWEPATDRTLRPAPVVRHWHADGTRCADGAWRFVLQPENSTP